MKKIYFFVFSLLGLSQINAQFTLTKSVNEPVVGNTYDTKTLDTNMTALPMTVSGSNVTWNVNGIFETGATSTNTFSANGGNASNFPGTTIVQEDQGSGSFSYFKSTSSSYELLGAEFSFSGVGAVLNYNTNSAIIAQYPMTYGYSNNDAIGGTITASTFSGPFSGTIKTNGDGTGTLNLNNTSLTNCLRLKTVQHASFTLGGGFVTGTLDQVIYNYFNSSSKWPVFTVNYSHLQTSGAQTSDQTQVQVTTLSTITVGLKENKLNDIIFKAYPNPANGEVFVHFVLTQKESYTIDLVNALGQVVRSSVKPDLQPGMYNERIDISGLSTGVYHLKVSGKNTSGVEKLIIE